MSDERRSRGWYVSRPWMADDVARVAREHARANVSIDVSPVERVEQDGVRRLYAWRLRMTHERDGQRYAIAHLISQDAMMYANSGWEDVVCLATEATESALLAQKDPTR
jgi:hypothetical protein